MWPAALWSAVIALVIGAAALAVIWKTRDKPLFLHVVIASLSGSAVVIGSSVVAVRFMVLGAEDLAIITTAVIVGAAVSAGVALALGLRVRAGSRRLHAMTRAIAAGAQPSVPRADTNREFHDVGAALSDAAQELHRARSRELQLERARVEAISWISHDLRTPLAGIRAMAESIEDGVVTDPGPYLRRISEQTESLAGLVDDLVEYSSVVSASATPRRDSVDLVVVTAAVVAAVRPIAWQKEVRIDLASPSALLVTGDPRRLHRAFQNLVENAVRYTTFGSTVRIVLSEDGRGAARFDIEDACETADPLALARVFEPGWRGDATRMSSPGTGLGLAIVHSVVSAHAGSVVADLVPGGCRFRVELPISVD
ncbi:sensor histidine kinase [Microbacterium oxydans]|uniref:sensor histidine kinase n=1 Tax=Microbacterium oxydans TaxID=82380 RepID=UPI00226BB6B7|nr:HAMP domain-containing sensor histidine kinase [Microbacterium oxydans]WAA67966.1 HAMP domain-containing histidine kinase [Microbacterium oxydans]